MARRSKADVKIPDDMLLERFLRRSKNARNHALTQDHGKITILLNHDQKTGRMWFQDPDWTRELFTSFALELRPFLFNENDSLYLPTVWNILRRDHPQTAWWVDNWARPNWKHWTSEPMFYEVPLGKRAPETREGQQDGDVLEVRTGPVNARLEDMLYGDETAGPPVSDIDMLNIVMGACWFHTDEDKLAVWDELTELGQQRYEIAAVQRLLAGSAFLFHTHECVQATLAQRENNVETGDDPGA